MIEQSRSLAENNDPNQKQKVKVKAKRWGTNILDCKGTIEKNFILSAKLESLDIYKRDWVNNSLKIIICPTSLKYHPLFVGDVIGSNLGPNRVITNDVKVVPIAVM